MVFFKQQRANHSTKKSNTNDPVEERWLVLGRKKLNKLVKDNPLLEKELQDQISKIELKPQQGKNSTVPKLSRTVYHAHIRRSYVLEWEIVDVKNKIVRIVGCDSHEQYNFVNTATTSQQVHVMMGQDTQHLRDYIEQYKAECSKKGTMPNDERFRNIIKGYQLPDNLLDALLPTISQSSFF